MKYSPAQKAAIIAIAIMLGLSMLAPFLGRLS